MKILISGKARIELMQIYSYLAERNADVAESVLQEVNSKLHQLSSFPYMGRERSELALHLRSVPIRTYLVFYQVIDEQVIVVRILDGRLDIDKEFRQ